MQVSSLKKQFGIGLTGGIATGKSTIAQFIRDAGYQCIDADQLARDVVTPGTDGLHEVVGTFGKTVLNQDGTLNRKALGAIVFGAPEKLKLLESILHPRIHAQLSQHLAQAGILDDPKLWFYEASLLFEAGIDAEYSQIWASYCDTDTQISRLCARNNITPEDAHKILTSQLPAQDKADRSDLTINTACTLEELKNKILSLLPPKTA